MAHEFNSKKQMIDRGSQMGHRVPIEGGKS
uniref:Uncharacterized protein n=1 Tax=Magnetococcus massalia (strain MO-1) TaxID=451514 RepID=A0A1S7LEZ7_MAGMO|nr:protein of unknown function [Candidatus Magnetococcus massalia]